MAEKKKTYYCPLDLQEINMDNLAYELCFDGRFSEEEAIKNSRFKAVTSVDGDSLIEDKDAKRTEVFGFDNEESCMMVLESRDPDGECGLRFLIENVRNNREEGDKDREATATETGITIPDENRYFDKAETTVRKIVPEKKRGWRRPKKTDPYDLVYAEENSEGNYEFYNKDKQRVMTALPCCPHCHMRLPRGWKDAEDFCIVSLIGPTGSGKTTMLLSLMADQWKSLGKNVRISGYDMEITPANYYGYGGFSDSMAEEADKLSSDDNPECPEMTIKEKLIQPVFLNVDYKGHRMTVGIYDNAGENLAKPTTLKKDFLKAVIEKSNVDMYLFDPEDMNIELDRNQIDPKSIQEVLKACIVDSIQEQGEKQKKDGRMRVTAREVLKKAYAGSERKDSDKKEKKKTTLDVYRSLKLARSESRVGKTKSESTRFLGVIIKSDLLKPMVDEREYGTLFLNLDTDPSNRAEVDLTSDTVTDMIKEYRLFGDLSEREVDEIGSEFKGRSWHCISALGCDAELHGALKGQYEPIRVVEPLIRCIVDRIADNGWIDEK